MTIISAGGFTRHLRKKPSKYKNVKCEWQGEKFDSKKELERHLVLLDMQKRGEIWGLQRQPRFDIHVNGKKICTYVADWAYVENVQGVVEDAKGFKTPDFKLKWKLVQVLYPSINWRLS